MKSDIEQKKSIEIEIPEEFQISLDTFLIYDFFEARVELYDKPDPMQL